MKRLRLVLLGLGAAALYFAVFGGEYSIFALRRLEQQRQREEAELRELHAEMARLRARVDSLRSDPATLERVARERYGMIRAGERLYRFAPAPDSLEDDADSAAFRRPPDPR